MTTLVITLVAVVAGTAGLAAGVRIGRRSRPDWARLGRYDDAMAVLRDLTSPDPLVNHHVITQNALAVLAEDDRIRKARS